MPLSPSFITTFLRNLRLTKGKFAGQYMPLQPFQEQLTQDVFAIDSKGQRKIREALIGLGRKNAKTKTVAGWALALLLEEQGGEIVGAAAKRDQAGLLLNAAKDFVKQSSINGVPLDENLFIRRRNSIYCPETDSVYRTISADADTELGLNPSVVLADELLAWKGARGAALWEALTTAQGSAAWPNPLLIAITTAGIPEGIWHELYKKGRAIERGVRNDPGFLMRWWEAAEGRALDDREGWHEANPGLGTIKSLDYMVRQYEKVGHDLSEYAFRRLHLNQPTAAHERWIPYNKWVACGQMDPDIPDGATVYVGIDAALYRDTFAVSTVWIDKQDPPQAHVKVKTFEPRHEGEYIDPAEVETYVLGLARRYRIREARYDPYAMELLAVRLADAGLRVEPMHQQGRPMSRAAENLQRFVIDERLRHGMDATLDKQMAAVEVRQSDNGARISKGKSSGHIDSVVALAMALDAAAAYELGREYDHVAFRVSRDHAQEERASDRRPVLADRVAQAVKRAKPVPVPNRDDYPFVREVLTEIIDTGTPAEAMVASEQRDRLDRKYERTAA